VDKDGNHYQEGQYQQLEYGNEDYGDEQQEKIYGQETDEYVHQMTEAEAIQQKIAFIKHSVKQNNGAKWVDDEWPAGDSALYKNPAEKPDYDDKEEKVDIVWRRPDQIVGPGEEAIMTKEGMTSGDVKQGALDDCWLLGSFLLLGTRP
jgi:calpain, invertebrate